VLPLPFIAFADKTEDYSCNEGKEVYCYIGKIIFLFLFLLFRRKISINKKKGFIKIGDE